MCVSVGEKGGQDLFLKVVLVTNNIFTGAFETQRGVLTTTNAQHLLLALSRYFYCEYAMRSSWHTETSYFSWNS